MADSMATTRTRRALLTGAIGAAAAAAAASLPVHAADGDTVKVGQFNQGTSKTALAGTGGGPAALAVLGTGGSTAIEAESATGLALDVLQGAIRVHGAIGGTARIARGRRSVTVSTHIDVNSRSFVLLSPMTNIGSRALWYTKRNVQNRIVIHMSSPRSAPTNVAWLLVQRG